MPNSFRLHFAFALLLLAACPQFTIAQDATVNAPVTYGFKAINFPGATGTDAYAINSNGKVVGFYTGAGCSQSSCGFTELKGKFTTIECSLENATDLFDISNKGEIVGAYSYFGGVNGFIWEGNSSCFPLSDSPANLTEAWGVNDGGTVVGFFEDAAGNFQGFEYTKGKYTTIACPNWTDTRALGINDAGLIVGDNANSTSGPYNGFLYKSGKCIAVNFPKAASTSAKGINKSGQISGWYTDAQGATHGFVKTGSSYKALNYPTAVATLGYHIDDAGQVAGAYSDTTGAAHGFIATPKK
jgi:uncharacterized membrane protein